MPDLSGKVIIVTGGNSGLGYESVKVFAQKGAEVILACRSVEKGEAAKTEIMKNNPAGKIEVMNLDLMDLSSVKNFAVRFKENHSHLNVLLNNAGIMIPPFVFSSSSRRLTMILSCNGLIFMLRILLP